MPIEAMDSSSIIVDRGLTKSLVMMLSLNFRKNLRFLCIYILCALVRMNFKQLYFLLAMFFKGGCWSCAFLKCSISLILCRLGDLRVMLLAFPGLNFKVPGKWRLGFWCKGLYLFNLLSNKLVQVIFHRRSMTPGENQACGFLHVILRR